MLNWWGDSMIMRCFCHGESYALHPNVLTPTIFSSLGNLCASGVALILFPA